jgi:ABC-2 type transport system permease protein
MRMSYFSGTLQVIRLILRRDRLRILIWIFCISAFTISAAAQMKDLYPGQTEREARAVVDSNPASIALLGPGYGLDNYTIGAIVANELGGWIALSMALMSILMIVRHTREEEKVGRTELMRATKMGRFASITAAFIVVILMNVLIGIFISAGLTATGLSVIGSWTLGLWVSACGIVYTGAASVFAQITEHPRSAIGLSITFLAITFLLRAVGDVGNGLLSMLSPIGWGQTTKPFVDEQWWPFLVSLLFASVLILAAFKLSTMRDVGAGLIPPKAGRANASSILKLPIGLAIILQRGSMLAWSAGYFILGTTIGSLGQESADFFNKNEKLKNFLTNEGNSNLTNSMFSTFFYIFALISAIYGIQSILSMSNDESSGFAEPVLVTAVSRWHYAASYLITAIVGSTVMLAAFGLGAGIMNANNTGEWTEVVHLLGAALAYLPATLLIIGLSIAFIGLIPRAVMMLWAIAVYCITIGILGPLLHIPDWLNKLSPFYHVPKLPSNDFTFQPLIVLILISAALMSIGLAAYHRRDIKL